MRTLTDQPVLESSIPKEVVDRLKDWKRHFKFWRRFNLVVGTIGTILSAMATLNINGSAPYLAAGATVCFAVLGFAHADGQYNRFVRAWRILDNACNHHRYAESPTLHNLIDAMEEGERLIAQIESTERAVYKPEEEPVSEQGYLPIKGTDRTKDELRH